MLQGDHSSALQIIQQDQHKVKVEDKSKVLVELEPRCNQWSRWWCHGDVCSLCLSVAPLTAADSAGGQLPHHHRRHQGMVLLAA